MPMRITDILTVSGLRSLIPESAVREITRKKEIKRIEKTEENLPETREENIPTLFSCSWNLSLIRACKLSGDIEDPIPNFRKMMKEYTSGYYKVPSVGAGTANTEFESITGMSLRYFGPGGISI